MTFSMLQKQIQLVLADSLMYWKISSVGDFNSGSSSHVVVYIVLDFYYFSGKCD